MRTTATIFAAALAFALAIPTPTSAQDVSGPAVADEAEIEFRLGNEAYVKGDYELALSHYFASYRLVPNRNVLFNVAKCYENDGQLVEAHRYYTQYLPGLTGAEAQEVERALERIARKVGKLTITTDPPGASIYFDRKNLGAYGTTPAEIVVKPGTYDIIVEREGWLPQIIKAVTVRAGGAEAHQLALVQRTGNVQFTGEPAGVTVQVLPDGAPMPVVPASLPIPVGTHTLKIDAPGWEAQVIEVVVPDAETLMVKYELQRQTGTLVVRASEPGAAVYVDDQLLGFAPLVAPVSVGKHQVVVRSQGFAALRLPVDIAADSRVELDAELFGADEVDSASLVAESVRDAPASVSLIGSREIEAFGYTGTSDALAGTRGVFFTNDYTYQVPGVRGYGPFSQFGNRTLVLLDGHATNDNWIEASYHEFELLSEIYGFERIEFVRGPTSVLYGSGGFQGVINLVSPSPDDDLHPSRVGVGASGDGVFRSYGIVREQFEGGGIQASVGSVQGQPGQFFSPAREAAGEPSLATGVGGQQAYTARLNAKWKRWTLISMFHTRTKNGAIGNYETLFDDPRLNERDIRAFLDVRYRVDLTSNAVLDTRAYGDFYGYKGQFPYLPEDGGVFTDRFSGVWAGIESRLELRPFENALWVTSIDGVRHALHRTRSNDEDEPYASVDSPFSKTSLSSTFRYEFTPRLSLSAGARYDLWAFDALPNVDGVGEDSRLIQNVNPRFVALLRPWDTGTIKLIGSRGFRAPSVYELTYNDGGFTQVSNPALVPETIWSSEIEYTQELVERFEGVLGLYTQTLDNRIEATGEGVETDPLQYQNVDERLWGAGFDVEIRRSFFRGWMGSATYSFQRTRAGDFDVLLEPGANVPNSPRHMASAKLIVPLIARTLRLANRVTYEAPRIDREGGRTPDILKWDLMFSGMATSVPVRWSVGVRNLLGWDIQHPVGDEIRDVSLPQGGRTAVADIAVTF